MSVRGFGRFFRLSQSYVQEAEMMACFPFLTERGHVISLVGGGGKTTLMNALARAYSGRGMKAAVTTTTRIMKPAHAVHTIKGCRARWATGAYAVCGEDSPQGKLRAPKDDVLAGLFEQADAVLIEADGAKRMACKAPAAHEPVILPQSDIVIGVMGAEVLGGQVQSVCFRPEHVCAALGCSMEHRLTAEDLAALLLDGQGTRKGVEERAYVIVINKCDDPQRLQSGMEIARALRARGHINTVLACLKTEA